MINKNNDAYEPDDLLTLVDDEVTATYAAVPVLPAELTPILRQLGVGGRTIWVLDTLATDVVEALAAARAWAENVDEWTASYMRCRAIYIALRTTKHVGEMQLQRPADPQIIAYPTV